MGLNTLAAGKARFVLVVGVEKMTELNSAQAGEVLIKASYVAEEANIEAGFAGIFGKITSAYFQRYGDKSDALARIAVKAHKNGAKNPYAHFQKEFAYEFCRTPSDKNPFVAGPLKRTDCSPVTDGAAAVDAGRRADRARHEAGDRLPRRRARQRLPAHEQARHHQVRGPAARLEARAGVGASSTCSISPSSRATTASPRPS